MKVAIHFNSDSFAGRWVSYLKNNNIDFKIVNAFASNIIQELEGYDIFLWHHMHHIRKDTLVATNILSALEHAGVKVFPNHKTAWHYDDKVAQKYLFEALGVAAVDSFAFYDKNEAIKWSEGATYPLVYKLKGGAGSKNVKLVESRRKCIRLIKKSFARGNNPVDRWNEVKELRFYRNKTSVSFIIEAVRAFKRGIQKNKTSNFPNDRGYIYFQKFIANNESDIRVIVIGDKAFAIKRFVRENDFRASGSGKADFDKEAIDLLCIKAAFDVNRKIGSQCIAYDFVFEKDVPLIVEISYGFAVEFYDDCRGYWDSHLNWHEGSFNPQEWILKNLLEV